MKRFSHRSAVFVSILGFLLLIASAIPASARNSEEFEGFVLQTEGHYYSANTFRTRVKTAILLLKERAPADFAIMRKYIVKIREYRASGANYNADVMTIDLGERTVNASMTWLTSVLAHETHHIRKYKETGKKLGDAHLMADKKAALQVMIDEELECNRVQIAVLEKIGAPQHEIDYLKAQKGDHFDIDKDGDYDWDDYQARDWE